MATGFDFVATPRTGGLSVDSRRVGQYLFELGRELVRSHDIGIGVIVSSDDGCFELASVAAGAVVATLSQQFTKVAAPISLFRWLREMPEGTTIVDRQSGRKWQKLALRPGDAEGSVRVAPVTPSKTEQAKIFVSDNLHERWGLDDFALGIAADRPWIPLEAVRSALQLDQDLDGARMSSLALYLAVRKSQWKLISEMIVQSSESPSHSFPIGEWLGIQSDDPRAFYRTAIVNSVEELTAKLTQERLRHTANRLTLLFSGSMSDAVRRRAERNGYRKGDRGLSIGAILPARQVGPEQLADLASSWQACLESNAERLVAQRRFQEFCERLGPPPAGIALVPA